MNSKKYFEPKYKECKRDDIPFITEHSLGTSALFMELVHGKEEYYKTNFTISPRYYHELTEIQKIMDYFTYTSKFNITAVDLAKGYELLDVTTNEDSDYRVIDIDDIIWEYVLQEYIYNGDLKHPCFELRKCKF